jgi:hypothetical protein
MRGGSACGGTRPTYDRIFVGRVLRETQTRRLRRDRRRVDVLAMPELEDEQLP